MDFHFFCKFPLKILQNKKLPLTNQITSVIINKINQKENKIMLTELTLENINTLPDNVIEELYIRMKAKKGLKDVEEGKTLSSEELKKELQL